MKHLQGGIYLALAFILAGSSVVAARVVAGSLGEFTVVASSLFLAFTGLLFICRKQLLMIFTCLSMADWWGLLIQAACGIFLFRLFLIKGLSLTSAGEAGVLTGATPAFTVILAFLLLKETPDNKRIAGIVSTIGGIVLIQGGLKAGASLSGAHLEGNLLVLAAAMCESLFNVSSKMDSVRRPPGPTCESNPLVKTTLVIGLALILSIIPAGLERPAEGFMALDAWKWLALLWYGLVVTAMGYIFWYAGIKRCPASMAASFSGLMPLTALILSVGLLGERPAGGQCLGGILVVMGMLLAGSNSSDKESASNSGMGGLK